MLYGLVVNKDQPGIYWHVPTEKYKYLKYSGHWTVGNRSHSRINGLQIAYSRLEFKTYIEAAKYVTEHGFYIQPEIVTLHG